MSALTINSSFMFLKSIKAELDRVQEKYSWTSSLVSMMKYKYDTKRNRFRLMLEILKYADDLWFDLTDPETASDVSKIWNLFGESLTYSHNPTIIKSKLINILYACAYEIKLDCGKRVDFPLVHKVMSEEITYEDFVKSGWYKVDNDHFNYSVTGKSWKRYEGKWTKDIMKMKTEDIEDIVSWADVSITVERIKNWIDENEKEIKEKFKSKRIAYVSLLKSMLYPDGNYEVINYIKSKMKI